ncbi:MAG TPA: MFS transporter [Reyranella sp.]|jgi:MHS family proline/betaine transporter-like MFS transporter|nr:MFS transporter [Reyranella sp.]
MTAVSMGASIPLQSRRAVTAAVIGNVLEWYDFAVYGFVAVYIGRNFFPGSDETTELLKAFLTFGLGFLARPVGGIIIGRLGDTHGRKTALLVTIFLMALGTILIGIMPTYASIGVAAPALLLIARLMQGFSTGGEWGGSTAFIVEWAPKGKRGLFGSFQQMSVVAGLLLGSAVAALMNTLFTTEQMADWGWRVPFLLGALLGPVGIYMRRTIDETPAYSQVISISTAPETGPGGFALAARAFGFTIVWTVCFYVLLTYMPSWTGKYMKLSASAALWSNTIGLIALIIGIPIMGHLSDRYGRRPLLLTCCAAFIILPWPLFHYLSGGNVPYVALVLIQIVIALVISLYSGAGPAAISEIFPTRRRSTWMTTGYALAVAIFGGSAPYLSIWMIEKFGTPIAPVWYLIASAVVSILVILSLKETAFDDLA